MGFLQVFSSSFSLRSVAAVLLGSVLLFGCAAPRLLEPNTATPFTKSRVLNSRAASEEVEAARRMIEAGDFSVVIPRLLLVITKYPESDAALDARYWLAYAYQELDSYRDAIDTYSDYVDRAPQGRYASEAEAALTALQNDYDERLWTPDKLDTRIAQSRKAYAATPEDVETGMELAELLWQRGVYQEAADIYLGVMNSYPGYRRDERITSRIEFYPNGQYNVLTPAEQQQRQAAADPLLIHNMHSFRSGEDFFTRAPRFYVVTGQTTNRGDSVLYGVQIYVTIYGFGNVVLDSQVVNFGLLNPGETRAFSIRFSNFENIENVNRHEAVGNFQR